MADDLTAQIRTLTAEVAGLRDELRADYEPAADTRRYRRRAVGTVLVALALSLVLNNGAISRCFLTSPTGIERRACSVLFVGYGAQRAEGDRALQQFQELLRAIPSNRQDVAELKRRVEKLERKGR